MACRTNTVERTTTNPNSRVRASDTVGLDFRGPVIDDAASMWRLVVESNALDVNSPYAYLLVCSHFASTSIIAEEPDANGLAGFVASYRVPDDPTVLFVWQIGVHPDWRQRGVGLRLLDEGVRRPGNRGVRYVHATVTPSNHASDRLFRSFADALGAPCVAAEQFPAQVFPHEEHEPEVLYRIGPFDLPPHHEEVTTTP